MIEKAVNFSIKKEKIYLEKIYLEKIYFSFFIEIYYKIKNI